MCVRVIDSIRHRIKWQQTLINGCTRTMRAHSQTTNWCERKSLPSIKVKCGTRLIRCDCVCIYGSMDLCACTVQVSQQPYLRRKILEINQLDGFSVSNNSHRALQIHKQKKVQKDLTWNANKKQWKNGSTANQTETSLKKGALTIPHNEKHRRPNILLSFAILSFCFHFITMH